MFLPKSKPTLDLCRMSTFSMKYLLDKEYDTILYMRTFIFSYDRYDSISTHNYVWSKDTTVLVHDESMKDKYIEHNPIFEGQIIATGQPKGLAYNRNYALNLMAKNEWAIFLVDDMKSLTKTKWLNDPEANKLNITFENQKQAKPLMRKPMSSEEFIDYAEIVTKKIGRLNCNLVGFSNYDNPIYRTNRYSYNCLADGRAWLVRKTDLTFDENVQLVDDTAWCAVNLKANYDIMIVNWILPDCRRYTKGAYGSKADRMEQKIRECKYLTDTYPDQVKYASKTGWEDKSHVRIIHRKLYDERLGYL